ncbi:MAG TPA: hypothetical protein QGF58_28770 [Myxococcota bacterium]|nr:hypothetical protein [Myxococcota bacterium]
MDRGRQLTRAWVGYPNRPFVGLSLTGVVRYLAYAALLIASLMFYTWSRVDVRATAAALEGAQLELSELRTEQDRLELELATRRDLARVGGTTEGLALISEVKVVEVP